MLPGAHKQWQRRAHGWACYWYAWRGGPEIGTYRAATEAEVEALVDADAEGLALRWAEARRGAAAQGTVARVVQDYRASPEYTGLAFDTRRTYDPWLTLIEAEFGACSPADLTDGRVADWRDKVFAARGARAADHGVRILSRVCSWGRAGARKKLPADCKPTEGLPALYSAPKQAAWSQRDVDLAMSRLRPALANAVALALNTGLRKKDLIAVTWASIDEATGKLIWVPSKGKRRGRVVRVRLTPALRMTLARIPKLAPQILTNSLGRPWTVNSIGHAMDMALSDLGIEGRLHGLRRSAATHLSRQGLSIREIARILGWRETEAEAMLDIYEDQDLPDEVKEDAS